MKIYTKTGDSGTTSLCGGKRVAKSHPIIHANGHLDECNAVLGLAIAQLPAENHFDEVREELLLVQHLLFDYGTVISEALRSGNTVDVAAEFDQDAVTQLEQWIDQMEEKLSPLKNFILPGGEAAAASIHLARGICRRAERKIVSIEALKKEEAVEGSHKSLGVAFINRLSDYLFVVARMINQLAGIPDTERVKEPLKQLRA